MNISVVIATYNGEKYILEQLQSLLQQSRKADEVIIIDDKSSDSTPILILEFIEKNNLCGSWSLFVNEQNLGWKKNFMEGFKRASGDIIFPCDQDDIWDCEKIKEMTSVMERNSQINVLASNLTPFYDNTKQNISSFYTNTIGKNYLEKVELDLLFLQTFRPGCSLAFRREFLDLVNLVWYPEWAHDSVLSTTAKLTNSFYVINRVLLYYRRHENVNSPQNIKNVKGRVETAQSYIHRANLFLDKSTELRLNPGTIMTIEKVKHFYLKKIECFQKRNSCIGFLNLLKYVRYYPSWKSFWGDIYIMLLSK